MARMTDEALPASGTETGQLEALVLAVVLGGALAEAAHVSTLALLVTVAVEQALFACSWFVVAAVPGRRGALPVLLAAAAAADVTVMHWPHSRLGTLLPVLGLVIPVLFVHQLARGVARVKLVESLAAVALASIALVSLAAFIQLRHEFVGAGPVSEAATAATGAAAAAIVAGILVDMVFAVPRLDPEVPRGLLAVLASAAVGGCIGYLVLKDELQFQHGRAAFVGIACGALAGLLSVAGSFAVRGMPAVRNAWAIPLRQLLAVQLALCVVAPGAFLVCLAIRT